MLEMFEIDFLRKEIYKLAKYFINTLKLFQFFKN